MGFRRYRRSAHKTNPINRGFKEKVIVEDLTAFLQSEHNIDIIAGKQIEGGSSKRRPDILINLETHSIIIEIDERQHRSYSTEDNDQRVSDLVIDLQGRKLVLIRFNPDSYKDSNRVVRKSLFSKTRGTRIYQIGCPNKYQERMNLLKKIVTHYLSNVSDNVSDNEYVEHKLYYDKFDSNSIIV